MSIDFETTLGDVKRICNAIEDFARIRKEIKAIKSEEYFKRVLEKLHGNEKYANNAIGRELKPRYQDYEILRNTIRDGIYTLQSMPDIPDLSEYLDRIATPNP